MDYRPVSETRRTGHSSSSDRKNARISAGENSWSIFVLVVAIILLLIYVITPAPAPRTIEVTLPDFNVTLVCHSALVLANETLCNRTSDCLQGYYYNNDTSCLYLPRPSSVTNCTSACYPNGPTQCDANGQCVGHYSSCVGACEDNPDCNDAFVTNDPVLFYVDLTNHWFYQGMYESGFLCWSGTCIYVIADIYVATGSQPLFWDPENISYAILPLAANIRCTDYLDPVYLAEHQQCLLDERYWLDSTLVNYTYLEGVQGNIANGTFPFQFSVCFFGFTCSRPIYAQVPSPTPEEITRKRSVSAPKVIRREDYGFYPTSKAGEAPMGPPMGIRDPHLQQTFWWNMQHKLKKEMLPRLEHKIEDRLATWTNKKKRNANVAVF